MYRTDFTTSNGRKTVYIFLYSMLFYIMFHTMFYILEQIHYNFCTPYGFSGFIQSFFTSQSTICHSLKTISWHTSNASSNMMYIVISIFGGYFTSAATTFTHTSSFKGEDKIDHIV
jgi:hypothetical protein